MSEHADSMATTDGDGRFYDDAVRLVRDAQDLVRRTTNAAMVYTYFELGRMIVEEEQGGDARAGYGKRVLEGLSERLTEEFGKGFSMTNLEQMRKFYRVYADDAIPQTLSEESSNLPVTTTGRRFFLS